MLILKGFIEKVFPEYLPFISGKSEPIKKYMQNCSLWEDQEPKIMK